MNNTTEIIVAFEKHGKTTLKKKMDLIKKEKPDVILLELPQKDVELLISGKIPPEVLAMNTDDVPTSTKMFKEYKKLADSGVKIIGTEPIVSRKRNQIIAEDYFSLGRNSIDSIKRVADDVKFRDEYRANWIKKKLKNFEGKKVMLEAGTLHTGIYHRLMPLQKMGIKTRQVYLTKGMYGKRTLEVFPPVLQLVRAFVFGTEASRNPEMQKRLLFNQQLYNEELSREYEKQVGIEFRKIINQLKKRKNQQRKINIDLIKYKADLRALDKATINVGKRLDPFPNRRRR